MQTNSTTRRRNRVYKSLHKPLTYLGVERTLFFIVCVAAVGTFNLFNSLLAGMAVFVAGFVFGTWVNWNDVPHTLILGATGTGKSYLGNFLLQNAQKYKPLTFIFDIGGSFEALTHIFGGSYLNVGREERDFTINPFSLPPTRENQQFLFSLLRVPDCNICGTQRLWGRGDVNPLMDITWQD